MTQRIAGVDPSQAEAGISAVLTAQSKRWGGPLLNHLVYARVPAIFRAVRSMWSGLNSSALLPEPLVTLVNRRVAALNQCLF